MTTILDRLRTHARANSGQFEVCLSIQEVREIVGELERLGAEVARKDAALKAIQPFLPAVWAYDERAQPALQQVATALAPPPAAEPFNICDTRHQYQPCPKCGGALGMGLSSRMNGKLISVRVVHPECGFEGPTAFSDRGALEAWNSLSSPAEVAAFIGSMDGGTKRIER